MAAALASASVVFKDANPAYSQQLLSAALKAYDFATKHTGLYNNAIPDAANFYRSSNMYDDLAWAATWLAVRTGDAKYRAAAKDLYMKHWNNEDGKGVWNNFDWDSNSWGATVFLSRWFPEDAHFKSRMAGFVKDWLAGGEWVKHTPKGLAFSGDWGSLRHVGNALFLMQAYAKGAGDATLKRKVDCFSHKQLDYIFGGASGRSFVVGYGPSPPQQPHHRAASCPALGTPCSWDAFNSPNPNPHTLYGALVGGPNGQDGYNDNRNNFVQNEVATDYNGGYTGALAAMVKPSITFAQCKSGGGKAEAVIVDEPAKPAAAAEPAKPAAAAEPAKPAAAAEPAKPAAAAEPAKPAAAKPAAAKPNKAAAPRHGAVKAAAVEEAEVEEIAAAAAAAAIAAAAESPAASAAELAAAAAEAEEAKQALVAKVAGLVAEVKAASIAAEADMDQI